MAAIEITPLAPPPGAQASPLNQQLTPAPMSPTAPFGLKPIQIQPLTPLYDPSVAQDALDNVMQSQKEAAAASAEALAQNTEIQKGLLDTQMRLQDDSMEAFDNLTRIARWGDISDILSLFNSKWSEATQSARIRKNDMIVQQQSLRATSKIQLNNAKPALETAEAELAEQNFANQLKVFDVMGKVKDLQQKDADLLVKSAELQINLSEEERQRIKLGAEALDLKGARAQLKLAQQGKGEWVGLEGILEEKISKDERADIEIENIKLAMQKNRLDLQLAAEARLAAAIPTSQAQALVTAAMAQGQSTINYRGMNLPTISVMEALDKNQKTEQAVKLTILNSRTEVVQNLFNEVSGMATALSSMDRRAANEAGLILNGYRNIDPNNPQSIADFKLILESSKAKLTEIAKDAAKVYKDPTAKAAIEQFGTTGRATTQGAQAVVQETVGNWSTGAQSKYSGAWGIMNQALARSIAQQNLAGAPVFDENNMSSSMQMLSWFAGQKNKRADQIKEEILTDPEVRDGVAKSITGTLAEDMANKALNTLAEGENQDPVWKTLINNKRLIYSGNAFDRRKLIDYLEKKTIAGGPNSIDYNQIFSDAMRAQVMTAANQGNTDPKYTVQDRFLETLVFGDNPAQAALGDFVVNYEADRQRSRDLALQNINKDVTRGTQTEQAVKETGLYGLAKVGIDPDALQRNIKSAPSATGTDLTADQIRTLYGGGVR